MSLNNILYDKENNLTTISYSMIDILYNKTMEIQKAFKIY